MNTIVKQQQISMLKLTNKKEGENVCPICGKRTTRRGKPLTRQNLKWHMEYAHGKSFTEAFKEGEARKKKQLEGVA